MSSRADVYVLRAAAGGGEFLLNKWNWNGLRGKRVLAIGQDAVHAFGDIGLSLTSTLALFSQASSLA